jgi:hypothetical protein
VPPGATNAGAARTDAVNKVPTPANGFRVESTAEPYTFSLDPPEVNLGVLRPDQDAAFEFTIVNADARPLKIVNLDGSCDCVSFLWDHRDVPAGGRTVVKTDVKAQNRGTKRLSVFVQANDRLVTTHEISIRYAIQPDLDFAPPRADFGRRMVGSATSLGIVVSYQLPSDAEPIELAPKLAADLPVTVKTNGPPEIVDRPGGLRSVRQRIELTLDTSKPLPAFDTQLVFQSERHLKARLPVTGAVHRGVYVDVDPLELGLLAVGKSRKASARLMWTRDEPKIETIECEPPELTATATREPGARSYRIQVTCEPKAAGDLDGVVRIRTSVDPEPLLLHVKGTIR